MAYIIDGNEDIKPLTTAGLVSVEHTIPSDGSAVKKGALVIAGQTVGFALSAGDPGDTIAVCIRCNLVDFPNVNKKLSAGDRIMIDNANTKQFDKPKNVRQYRPDLAIGIVHRNHPLKDTRIELVFAHD